MGGARPAHGWLDPSLLRRWDLQSHPQEIAANSVDAGHLAMLHGYDRLRITSPLRAEGAHLTIGYRMVRRSGIVAGLRVDVPFQFDIQVHGLGYSLIEVTLRTLGLRSRMLVLPSPVEGEQILLRIAV